MPSSKVRRNDAPIRALLRQEGFDAAVAIAREVVAEKDAEITLLETENERLINRVDGLIDLKKELEVKNATDEMMSFRSPCTRPLPHVCRVNGACNGKPNDVPIPREDPDPGETDEELLARARRPAEPRKVSDAQREALEKFFLDEIGWADQHKPLFMAAMVAIIELPADAEATT